MDKRNKFELLNVIPYLYYFQLVSLTKLYTHNISRVKQVVIW